MAELTAGAPIQSQDWELPHAMGVAKKQKEKKKKKKKKRKAPKWSPNAYRLENTMRLHFRVVCETDDSIKFSRRLATFGPYL